MADPTSWTDGGADWSDMAANGHAKPLAWYGCCLDLAQKERTDALSYSRPSALAYPFNPAVPGWGAGFDAVMDDMLDGTRWLNPADPTTYLTEANALSQLGYGSRYHYNDFHRPHARWARQQYDLINLMYLRPSAVSGSAITASERYKRGAGYTYADALSNYISASWLHESDPGLIVRAFTETAIDGVIVLKRASAQIQLSFPSDAAPGQYPVFVLMREPYYPTHGGYPSSDFNCPDFVASQGQYTQITEVNHAGGAGLVTTDYIGMIDAWDVPPISLGYVGYESRTTDPIVAPISLVSNFLFHP